ncbi:unnamed protein product [Symbiodinium necroappetens]|uniref:Reticulocyte-binding protein 2-like a n=1 Tax=Symbiodinium necroappetens TaxID=1628268 RepID=A0A812NH83_9DINO|nr:unnamed protein product [Symbiodinium necroappetens]
MHRGFGCSQLQGRGRGGRGRGRGAGKGGRGTKAVEDPPETPSPKPAKAANKTKAQKPADTTPESPPKTKKPKAAAKNPTPKKESKKSPKASKASGEAEKPEAIEGKKKRARHENFEDKSFARRVRPSGELTSLRWQVIRDVFYEKIHTNVPIPSSHQDPFWLLVKPRLGRDVKPEDYKKVARKAAAELAVLMILCGSPEGALAAIGIECSSFVLMNSGTSKRIYPPLFARRVVNMVLPAKAQQCPKPAEVFPEKNIYELFGELPWRADDEWSEADLGEGSAETVPSSTATLGRGMALLDDIAKRGVIKEELPDDEAEIMNQIKVLKEKLEEVKQQSGAVQEPTITATLSATQAKELQDQAAEKQRQEELARAQAKELQEQDAAAAAEQQRQEELSRARAHAKKLQEQEAAAEKQRQEELALARARAKKLQEQEAAAEKQRQEELSRAHAKKLQEQEAAAAAAAAEQQRQEELSRAHAKKLQEQEAAAEQQRQALALAHAKTLQEQEAAAEKKRQELASHVEAEKLRAETEAKAAQTAAELASLEAAQKLLHKQTEEAKDRQEIAAARLAEVQQRNQREAAEAEAAMRREEQIRAEARESTNDIAEALEQEARSNQELQKTLARARQQEERLAEAKAKVEAARAQLMKTPQLRKDPSEVWTQDAQPQGDLKSTQRCLSFQGCTPTETESPASALGSQSPTPPQQPTPPPAQAEPSSAATTPNEAAPKAPTVTASAQPAHQQHHVDPPSRLTLLKRINRIMEPTAKGDFKVNEDIRKQWHGHGKEGVFKLFAQCGNDPEAFIKRFSVTRTSEKEMKVGVEFEFLTKQEMADDQHMTEDEIDACVAAAEKNPEKFMKHPYKRNVWRYYCELKISQNQELAKIVKRLGFPELQEAAKPSSIIVKALDAVTKRQKQLEDIQKLIGMVEKPSTLLEKSTPQLLMSNRVNKMYDDLDKGHDSLLLLQSNGLLDGYLPKLFDGINLFLILHQGSK